MSHLPDSRVPRKKNLPTTGLPLFDWSQSSPSNSCTLRLAAHRIARRCGVPIGVALVHAEAAGLGKEAAYV
jgi:hypothetical protein